VEAISAPKNEEGGATRRGSARVDDSLMFRHFADDDRVNCLSHGRPLRDIRRSNQHLNGLCIGVDIVLNAPYIIEQRNTGKNADADCCDKDECLALTHGNLVVGSDLLGPPAGCTSS